MIKLENVNKYFYRHKKNQIHVINNTSLKLEEKGLVSLLGPSGCGKTTLLNTIGGLDKINSGKIYVDGKRISKRSVGKIDKIRNLNIGYIFQDYNLLDNMTVFDNVALALRINGLKNKEEIKKRVNYVLEKVDMYKYRNRLTSMLSGGQRQRVGIARAIVKNPKIIIADEPTGNLDSRNTIEVMNIIKAISKNKLVILVTHERELAEFYSTRIIEIEDGKVVNDRKNEHNNELDYRIDNTIYLKEFSVHEELKNNDISVNFYGNKKEKLNINVIIQNGNIFIETDSNNKVELTKDANIEIINDHYKKISKEDAEKYDFDVNSVSDKKYKSKYSSILNPFTLLTEGYKKVRDYSIIKKLLLFGFFMSGLFVFFSISSLFGIRRVDDANFIKYNKNYLSVEMEKVKIADYNKFNKDENTTYVIPGNSIVTAFIPYSEYYQTYYMYDSLSVSLSSVDMIKNETLLAGRMPENEKEVVIDKKVFDNIKENNTVYSVGIYSVEDFIGRKIYFGSLLEYTVVGVTDLSSPSLYIYPSEMNNIIYFSKDGGSFSPGELFVDQEIIDYKLLENYIKLKKGRYPTKEYEVLVNYDYKDQYKLNKTINYKINKKKVKVVGYYTSNTFKDKMLVAKPSITILNIINNSDLMIYTKDKESYIDKYKEEYNIKDSYIRSRDEYIKEKNEDTKSVIKASIIFLAISLIEIYLMIRSSFLSRIKEVGILRAIGVKKQDIYKMFTGEILVITTIGSVPGILFMAYALNEISFIDGISDKFLVDAKTILVTIVFIYIFNLIVGLLPVYKTIRKTPAQILSRTDIQ